MNINNKIKSIIMSHVDYIQQDEGVNSIEIRIEDIDQIINEIVMKIIVEDSDTIMKAHGLDNEEIQEALIKQMTIEIKDKIREENNMKTIQEVAEQAALVLMFENTETLPMTEITFSPKGEGPNYSIRVPKAFLEDVYATGFKDGFSKCVEIRQGEILIEIAKQE